MQSIFFSHIWSVVVHLKLFGSVDGEHQETAGCTMWPSLVSVFAQIDLIFWTDMEGNCNLTCFHVKPLRNFLSASSTSSFWTFCLGSLLGVIVHLEDPSMNTLLTLWLMSWDTASGGPQGQQHEAVTFPAEITVIIIAKLPFSLTGSAVTWSHSLYTCMRVRLYMYCCLCS